MVSSKQLSNVELKVQDLRLVSLDVGLDLGLEYKDLRLDGGLQNNDLVPPLVRVLRYGVLLI